MRTVRLKIDILNCQVCKKGVLQTGEYKNPPRAIVTHEDTLNTYPPKVPRAWPPDPWAFFGRAG